MNILSFRSGCLRQFIGECLTTHSDLTSEDILYALDYKVIDYDQFSDEQIASIAVNLTKTTYMGMYSLTFNYYIDSALKTKNVAEYKRLLAVDYKMAFPEYYEQLDQFTAEQKKSIEETNKMEYNIMYKIIKKLHKSTFPLDNYLVHKCVAVDDNNEIIPSIYSRGGVKLQSRDNPTLYTNFSQQICQSFQTSNVNLIETINLPHPGSIVEIRSLKCVNLIELLHSLTRLLFLKKKIDPLLQKRLSLSLTLYRYYFIITNQLI